MLIAYKAEYEHTDISIQDLLKKYQLDKEDIKGYKEWTKVLPTPRTTPRTVIPTTPTDIVTIVDDLPVTIVTDSQLKKIEEFKELALEHCLKFMQKDAQFSEVKEFKDIVAIVNTLEVSYQKADPDAGKPTINIMINNLLERFNDDC